MTNTYSQFVVMLDRDMNISRRTALVERLQRIGGIANAFFDSRDTRHLTIKFRNGSLSPATILDYLARQNAAATLALATEQPDTITQ